MKDFDRKCRIFISGPISGVPNYRERFAVAEWFLKSLFVRGKIFNPAARLKPGMSNAWYMGRCVPEVLRADYFYVLDGWKGSAGARIEVALARYCGKSVFFEEVEA